MVKHYTRLLGYALLGTIIVSCTEQYNIKGSSMQSVFDGKMVFLRETDTHAQSVDSCEIVHGNFKMSGKLDSVRCVTLDLGGFNIPIILEQGEITVTTENQAIKIEGTPLNDKLYDFLNQRDSLMSQIAELPHRESQMILEGENHDEIMHLLGEEEAQLRMAMDKLETTFITDNFDNILGTTWFLQLCNDAYNRFGYPTTTPQIDEIYMRAPETFRNNHEIADYMRLCNEN